MSMYTNYDVWVTAKRAGLQFALDRSDYTSNGESFLTGLAIGLRELSSSRLTNYTGEMLASGANKGQEYMTKYLQIKAEKHQLEQEKRELEKQLRILLAENE